jgi:hypothetical protein
MSAIKTWMVRIKRWASILGLFLLGAIAGIAYYHAFLTFQEVTGYSDVRHSVLAQQAHAELLGTEKTADGVSVITPVEGNPSEDIPSAVDPCTLRDVVCEGENSIEEIISRYFPEDPKMAIAIAKAESGLRVDAINENSNGTRDGGLFQVNDVHGYSMEERLDLENNVRIAREIYEKSGWFPWVAYKSGAYKKFM